MSLHDIKMLDLDYSIPNLNEEINGAILEVVKTRQFIKGPQVAILESELSRFLSCEKVVTCGNGTDALQLALMALDLPKGSEIIVPTFAYIAAAEVVKLLGYECKFVDVDFDTFNIDVKSVEENIGPKTKAIIVVHLFGQGCDMLKIMKVAKQYNLYVIEDNAQSLGADYYWPDGTAKKLGTIGHIGTTSFFPSKNLGCFGDGGAVYTNDVSLGEKISILANHGQVKKYIHSVVGINSRLDTIQAAVLLTKLKYYHVLIQARQQAALYYNNELAGIDEIILPGSVSFSNHVFHQYVIKVKNGKRNVLKSYLAQHKIPTMVYYPLCIHQQEAYKTDQKCKVAEQLVEEVLALPMHTELSLSQIQYIATVIKNYFF
jgi:dTDP-4-amino-4,6-dideoxygalactose transaminase